MTKTRQDSQSIILQALRALGDDASFVAVGGYVRDRLLGRSVGDLDLATALMPEVVIQRAKNLGITAIPTGLRHGTTTIVLNGENIEITTYRGDGEYFDGRHPSSVKFGASLEEDLARRDFTINAMALPIEHLDSDNWQNRVIDPFGGRRDLDAKLIKAVGDPLVRFDEDGLRPYRACRFVSQLGFSIEPATKEAIPKKLDVASKVSAERVFVELTKLLTGTNAPSGLRELAESGLLGQCLPELLPSIGCSQNDYHAFDVWGHTLEVVRHAPADPVMRWAVLLHDIGKPGAKFIGPDGRARFHGHEALSEQLAHGILDRLKASNALQAEVLALIRHHGARPDQTWGDAACRRLLHRLDKDGLDWRAWAALQLADQMGKGLGTESVPQSHAELLRRMEGVAAEAPPLNVRALAMDGNEMMKLAGRPPGPWVGGLQKHLLEMVMDDPKLNNANDLEILSKKWLESQH